MVVKRTPINLWAHRKCSDVETIMSAAEKRKKQDFIKILSRKIAQFEKELCSSKGKYEENLIEIESKNDSIKEVTKRLHEEIIDHLEKIENEHMNELGEVTKRVGTYWISGLILCQIGFTTADTAFRVFKT